MAHRDPARLLAGPAGGAAAAGWSARRSGGGLDLSGSTLVDLTGNSSYLYGELLTPGRPGEEMDYMAMSPDGEYVAIVRDIQSSGTYSYYYYGYGPMCATLTTSGAYASC